MEVAAEPAEEGLELNCPLCGYDLRGLPTHRCPECGHAFDPEELRQAKLERREWFFEHARRWHLWSFLKTASATARPIRFWRGLVAAHVIVPRRLLIWAAVGSLMTAVVIGVALAAAIWRAQTALTPVPGAWNWGPTWNGLAVANMEWFHWIGFVYDKLNLYSPLAILAVVAAWPVVTILILQLFGTTLRTAGIHAGHLWRCTLYALPMMLVPTAIFAAASCHLDVNDSYLASWPDALRELYETVPKAVRQMLDLILLSPAAAVLLAWCAVVSTVHLAAAHVLYLRLPHAIAQALLVQLTVWLLVFVVLVFGSGRV